MRPIRAVFFFLVSAVISLAVTYFLVVRPRIRAWGVDPTEIELPLPGDELIAEPSTVETRGVTIDAPVSKVWPYLVQMGFGRAGWYSYDVLDNKGKSAEGILPEYQHLAEGDVMPVSPGGGFEVKKVDFERSLVLYTDTEIVRRQAEQAQADATAELPTAALKVNAASYPEFSASWAFFLKSTEDGKTRLVERFRAKTPGSGPATAVLGEVMGTGIILMTRKQMLGIKERVERELGIVEPAQPIEEAAEPAAYEPRVEVDVSPTDTAPAF